MVCGTSNSPFFRAKRSYFGHLSHCFFGCGDNEYGQLGIGSNERTVPTELPITVDDIITGSYVTVIRSGNTLLACGDNSRFTISSKPPPRSPPPLELPGPVVMVLSLSLC